MDEYSDADRRIVASGVTFQFQVVATGSVFAFAVQFVAFFETDPKSPKRLREVRKGVRFRPAYPGQIFTCSGAGLVDRAGKRFKPGDPYVLRKETLGLQICSFIDVDGSSYGLFWVEYVDAHGAWQGDDGGVLRFRTAETIPPALGGPGLLRSALPTRP